MPHTTWKRRPRSAGRNHVTDGIGCFLAAIAICFQTGCGQSGPPVQFVQGRILLDGQPVSGATVGFGPINTQAGLPAAGTTNADGIFRLTATGGAKAEGGTLPGEYVVTVLKVEQPGGKPLPTPDDPDYGKSGNASVPTPAGGPPRYIVPEPYSRPETSGLKATVAPGKNTGEAFTFDLDPDFKGAGH